MATAACRSFETREHGAHSVGHEPAQHRQGRQNGNNQGCRYPPTLHRLGLSLLFRCGKSAHDQLQKRFGALPVLSQMQKCKNFVPQNETGVLHSMLEAMMHDVVRPNVPCHKTNEQLDREAEAESAQAMAAAGGHVKARTVGGRRVKDGKPRRRNACVDEEWVRSVCVSFDEMTVHGHASWNADHTRVVGGSDDDRNVELMVREHEREMATFHTPRLATRILRFGCQTCRTSVKRLGPRRSTPTTGGRRHRQRLGAARQRREQAGHEAKKTNPTDRGWDAHNCGAKMRPLTWTC